MHGRKVISVSRIDGLIVERPDRRAKIDLPRAYTRDKIPSRRNQIPTPAIAERWPHLQRIKEKIPELEKKIEIGLLIGCNCPKAIKPEEIITGKSEEPYAIRTLLGWCIVGPTNFSTTSDKTDSSDESSCNRILAQEVNDEGGKLEFVVNQPTKEMINPLAVTQMFELDFSEHRDARTQGLSKEDRRFLNLAETGIHRCDDGHYELPLHWKQASKVSSTTEKTLSDARFTSKSGLRYQTIRNLKESIWTSWRRWSTTATPKRFRKKQMRNLAWLSI